MNKDRLYYLLEQYSEGKASGDEVEEMFSLLKSSEGEELFKDFIAVIERKKDNDISLHQQDWNRMWDVIQSTAAGSRASVFSLTRVKMAAAVLVFIIAGIVVFFIGKKNTAIANVSVSKNNHPYKDDITPGGNKATLTLSDGTTIVLDSMQNGSLTEQGNTKIVKLNTGQLAYNTDNKKPGEILYNTISTPKGGQYQVVLSDSTNVWLNAASSLHFPASFAGKERTVELTGEGYFEVAKNRSMPFHVKVNGMDVLVTGTHFNVMAYTNEENIKTTLLEGKVKVTPVNGTQQDLEPGRQAIMSNKSHDIKMTSADIDQVMAWKNGNFHFRETNIREVMRQAERWYNVDVEYRTNRSDQDYTGVIPRMQNASALLQTLELTGTVHFQIEGKKIIVLP